MLHRGSHCGAGLYRSVPDDLTVCVLQGRYSSQDQFKVLHERYPLVSNSTRGLLLSTYLKMLLADPSNSGLQGDVTGVFSKCSHQMDPDLQQRSAEYLVRTGREGHNMHVVTSHALAPLLRCRHGCTLFMHLCGSCGLRLHARFGVVLHPSCPCPLHCRSWQKTLARQYSITCCPCPSGLSGSQHCSSGLR